MKFPPRYPKWRIDAYRRAMERDRRERAAAYQIKRQAGER